MNVTVQVEKWLFTTCLDMSHVLCEVPCHWAPASSCYVTASISRSRTLGKIKYGYALRYLTIFSSTPAFSFMEARETPILELYSTPVSQHLISRGIAHVQSVIQQIILIDPNQTEFETPC